MTTNQWPCDDCNRSFGRKGDLTRHKRIHTGDKPYICAACGKSFPQRTALNAHSNTHTGKKPHVCKFSGCGMAFGDPSSCTRHEKERHRCVGAYRCPYSGCKSSIKRRSAFVSHLKDKHNYDPSMIDINKLAPPLLPAPGHRLSTRKPFPGREKEDSVKPYAQSVEWNSLYRPPAVTKVQSRQGTNDLLVQYGHFSSDTVFCVEPNDIQMLDSTVFFSTESPYYAIPELCYSSPSSATSSPSPAPSDYDTQLTTNNGDAYIFNALGQDLGARTPFGQFDTPGPVIFQRKQGTFW